MISALLFDQDRDEIKDIKYWPCQVVHQEDDDLLIKNHEMVSV